MKLEAGAAAALTVCESLLLTLEESGALTQVEVRNLLTDAAEAHRVVARETADRSASEVHEAAARLVERIRDGEPVPVAVSPHSGRSSS